MRADKITVRDLIALDHQTQFAVEYDRQYSHDDERWSVYHGYETRSSFVSVGAGAQQVTIRIHDEVLDTLLRALENMRDTRDRRNALRSDSVPNDTPLGFAFNRSLADLPDTGEAEAA